MYLLCYPRLSTRSRRALVKIKTRGGLGYQYRPRRTLIERLARELGLTPTEVYNQLLREREYFINKINL